MQSTGLNKMYCISNHIDQMSVTWELCISMHEYTKKSKTTGEKNLTWQPKLHLCVAKVVILL
jgi:hypothetical protein